MALIEVFVLLREELVALLQFVVFLDRLDVHGPHRVELRLHLGDLQLDGVPIGRHRHLFGDRGALVGDGDIDRVAADILDIDLILLPDAVLEVLGFHPLLGELDFQARLLRLRFVGLFADGAQFFLGLLDAGGHFAALVLQPADLLLGLLAGDGEFRNLRLPTRRSRRGIARSWRCSW